MGNACNHCAIAKEQTIEKLHEQHSGIVAIKAIARNYIWWPNLDAEIELMVKNCAVCQAVRKAPPSAPLYPWRWPARVWQGVHIDFAEKDGNYFLGLVDSHSLWIEVAYMRSTTAQSTINGPQFISQEFTDFLKKNGFKQTLVPPYHPSSNGAAERTVRS